MRSFGVLGAALAMVAAGCAHDSDGHRIRTGSTRFDALSVSATGTVYTLEDDGTWTGMAADRYERVGDNLHKVGGFSTTPSLISPSALVRIDHRPDGLTYTPSNLSAPVWTFLTEDGRPIPTNLEVPLYLTARLGLSGQWVDLWTPGSERAGLPLKADCGVVLFDLQERQVAGWVALQGAVCPEPRYPGRDVLARLVEYRNEVWESPLRPAP